LFGDDAYRSPSARLRRAAIVLRRGSSRSVAVAAMRISDAPASRAWRTKDSRVRRIEPCVFFPLFHEPELHQSRFFDNMLQTISFLAPDDNHVDRVAPDINCRQPTITHCSSFVKALAVGPLVIIRALILTKRSFQRDDCRLILLTLMSTQAASAAVVQIERRRSTRLPIRMTVVVCGDAGRFQNTLVRLL
jgi:hypothetical protein